MPSTLLTPPVGEKVGRPQSPREWGPWGAPAAGPGPLVKQPVQAPMCDQRVVPRILGPCQGNSHLRARIGTLQEDRKGDAHRHLQLSAKSWPSLEWP